MTIQPKLLKVLEEKRLRRLGDLRDRNIDVVLLAATHQDLSKLVAESKFRSDLFFRVSTIPLWIPPLRERKEDIRMLAAYLLRQLQADLGRPAGELTPNALLALESYSWPGNIRELRNVLERALLLCKEGTIGAEDLIFQLPSKPALRTREDLDLDQLTLEQVEVRHIAAMLRLENGVIEKAAARLDISRSTLYSKIKLYNIKLLEN